MCMDKDIDKDTAMDQDMDKDTAMDLDMDTDTDTDTAIQICNCRVSDICKSLSDIRQIMSDSAISV